MATSATTATIAPRVGGGDTLPFLAGSSLFPVIAANAAARVQTCHAVRLRGRVRGRRGGVGTTRTPSEVSARKGRGRPNRHRTPSISFGMWTAKRLGSSKPNRSARPSCCTPRRSHRGRPSSPPTRAKPEEPCAPHPRSALAALLAIGTVDYRPDADERRLRIMNTLVAVQR